VLFIAQDASFLAAVQVIVYAGAIVVLFLFVLMLLGVDEAEDLSVDPLVGQRPAAVVAGFAGLIVLLIALAKGANPPPGLHGATKAISDNTANIVQLARVLFTTYVLAFEITAVLLTIAVVGAVVLARRPTTAELEADAADPDEARAASPSAKPAGS
jgi:NADH-quinone oxidoreductase subunit J